jgi:hypothetical protein
VIFDHRVTRANAGPVDLRREAISVANQTEIQILRVRAHIRWMHDIPSNLQSGDTACGLQRH